MGCRVLLPPGMYHHSQLKDGLNADYNSDPINASSSLIFLAHERKVPPRQPQSSLPVPSKTLTVGIAARNLLGSKLSCMHPVPQNPTLRDLSLGVMHIHYPPAPIYRISRPLG